jgi:uncharacterized membrane protein YheB (UPF0754 family)
MDSQTLITGLVTIGVGAISGGITNAVAIWMLFHPYEPTGFWRFRLQGAMPKNKARLARSIGRTVGERLLTPEDLAARLGAPAVREAFDAAIGRIVSEILERERGPLRGELPPEVAATLDEALAGVPARVADRVAAWARSPELAAMVGGWAARLEQEVGERPLADTLTAERREALRHRVEDWVGELVEGPELESTLRGWVDQQLTTLSTDEQPLIERLPPGLVGALEHAIADYLPVALERLGGLLADPEARLRIQSALRDAFDGAVRDLLIHERLLARLVVTDRTIERLVDGFERDGFDRFADALADPALRSQVAHAVNDSVVNVLRVPVGERLARLGPERRAALAETLGDWLLRVVRDPSTRQALGAATDRALAAAERRTWGEVIRLVPAQRLSVTIADALAGPAGRRWVEESVAGIAERLLARPIGRPADWLGERMAEELKRGVAEAAWRQVQEQIPRVVAQLDIESMVEQKVLGFSTQRMEEIVRTVTQRELDLIVKLGYLLGAIVGVIAFLVGSLLR